MKQQIIRCENCGEETRHLIGRKESVTHGKRRSIKHCCKCGQRIIKNRRKGQYIKDYSNKNDRREETRNS